MNFKNNLKNLIEKNNLNNNQLSIKLGISRSTISKYLNGTREPSFELLEKLTVIFNCSYDDLLK